MTCGELGCERRGHIRRERQKESQERETTSPSIHIGFIGSGDTVIQSGRYRDEIANDDKIIAFEMEEARVWEFVTMPTATKTSSGKGMLLPPLPPALKRS